MNEEENKVEVTETEETVAEETVAEETVAEEAVAEEAVAEETAAEGNAAEEPKEAAPAEKKDVFAALKKNIKLVAIAVVALLLICIIAAVAANSGSAFTLVNEKASYFQKDTDTLVTLNGDEVMVDEGISGYAYSADKSLTVVKDKEGTLFVVDGTELVKVAGEVEFYVISNYGDSIAYIAGTEEGVGTLHLYNVSKKSDAVIAEKVYAGDVVLSADGKSVAYLSDCEMEMGWLGYYEMTKSNMYVSKNGKEGKQVAKDAVPLAVTDGGKHVFYIKDGEKLYMDEKKLDSGISSRVYFNQDYSEIVYNKDENTQYFRVKMKEPVKVKKGTFSGIYAPENMVVAAALTSNSKFATESFGVDTFNEKLWCIDYSEAYFVFDKGEETEKLSSYLRQYQMSENGKSMLYQDGGELILIEDMAKSRDGQRVAYGLYNVEKFTASADLEDIYYYNYEEDELCYNKKGEGVHIADDAENFLYSDKYGVVYYIEDDELFYAGKTAKSKKIVCGEEVTSVFELNGNVYFTFLEDDVYSVMKMKSKGKYETVFEYEADDIFDFDFSDWF